MTVTVACCPLFYTPYVDTNPRRFGAYWSKIGARTGPIRFLMTHLTQVELKETFLRGKPDRELTVSIEINVIDTVNEISIAIL